MYDSLQELVNELEATCEPEVQQKLVEALNSPNVVKDLQALYEEIFGE